MRLILLFVAAALGGAVLWSQGAPQGGPALVVACLAACLAEGLGVRLPHYGTVSFGLVVYVPMVAYKGLGASSALAVALVALVARELLAFSTTERMIDEILLDFLPLCMACLAPTLLRPGDPDWLLWLAVGFTFITVRHIALQMLRSRLPRSEADIVKRLQGATVNLRWGILGLALLSIPLSQNYPVLLLALLPVLLSMRKSAIHAWAYLDKEDKNVLRKSLKGATTQVVELTKSLQTTEVERNLLFDLSKDTVRCTSLPELLLVVEKKARSLKLGRKVELLLQESSHWLFARFDDASRPLCGPINPGELDSRFKECWQNGTSIDDGRTRAFHLLPGIGVLSLEPIATGNAAKQLAPVMSLFCSQVSLACLSAHRFEVLERTLSQKAALNSQLEASNSSLESALAQKAALNRELEIGNESLRVAMDKLKTSEAKLIEGAKLAAVGQLSAGLAHEINNPLGSIRLGIEATLRKEQLSPFSKDLLEKGLKGVQRAQSVIGSLLTYSRAGTKGQVNVNIWDVIFDTASFLNASLRIQGITVKVPERGPDAVVHGNLQELQQILTNLLLNAKDAVEGQKEPVVAIRAGSSPQGEFHLEVHDSGAGIPADVIAKIFDPFFTTKPVGKGTGLGLSVSREMAAAQGGRLEAGASNMLPGACFRLTLPLVRKS